MSPSVVRWTLCCSLAILFGLSLGAGNASADIINFDNLSGPGDFATAGAMQQLTIPTSIGNVVISGGVILAKTAFLPADQTPAYGTEVDAFGGDPSLASAVTLLFPQNITNFFLNLYNGLGDNSEDYLVSDNLGNSITVSVPGNFLSGESLVAFANNTPLGNTITVKGAGDFAAIGLWDFFVDNIGFDQIPAGTPITPTTSTTVPPVNPPPTTVPEPGTLTLLAIASAGLLLLRLRRPVWQVVRSRN